MKKAVRDEKNAAVVYVSEMLHRLISFVSSLSFYTTFSHPYLSTQALRLFYLLDNEATRVVLAQPLTPLHDTFFVMNCPFLLQVDAAGDGSTTKKIKMNG